MSAALSGGQNHLYLGLNLHVSSMFSYVFLFKYLKYLLMFLLKKMQLAIAEYIYYSQKFGAQWFLELLTVFSNGIVDTRPSKLIRLASGCKIGQMDFFGSRTNLRSVEVASISPYFFFFNIN